MSHVTTSQFVAALCGIGIEMPKGTRKATIRLAPGELAVIECEVIVQKAVDVTLLDSASLVYETSPEVVVKRFKLVEDAGE